jgi:hypothetical protein
VKKRLLKHEFQNWKENMPFLYYELKSTHLRKEKKIILIMDFFSFSKKNHLFLESLGYWIEKIKNPACLKAGFIWC